MREEGSTLKNTGDKKYFFDDTNDLVNHLYTLIDNISPLKLQKGLYFLYAYYIGIYGGEEKEGVSEMDYRMPRELFEPNFEAWTYGPVMPDIYRKRKANLFEPIPYEFDDSPEDQEVKSFIVDLVEQIKGLSDFTLVDRSHEDKSWHDAYFKQGKSSPISPDAIKSEYAEKFS